MASVPREDYDDTTPTREQLLEELRQLEDRKYGRDFTAVQQKRVQQIVKILNECICRHCRKKYDMQTSRALWQGFCSMRCQHARAKYHGWKKHSKNNLSNEAEVLRRSKDIGSVYVVN